MHFVKVLATLFCFNFSFVVGQLERGDVCTIKSSGKSGVCKFISQCSEAIAGLSQGRYPQICGFQGTQSIVCCPGKAAPVVQSRTPGQIANEKCKEYSQYVWSVEVSPLLVADAEDIKRNDCPFEKQELIVGGERASRREFPHMVHVGYGNSPDIVWNCGGSLISDLFVLTAAHCLESRNWGVAKFARMGITDQADLEHLQSFKVIQRIRYPSYEGPSHYNDIALLKLDKTVEMNSFARPACIHTKKEMQYSNVIATGWGLIDYAETENNKDLLRVVLELFDLPRCNKTYKSLAGSSKLQEGIKDDLMVCAGSSIGLKDSCQGDSGGPIQVYKDGEDEMGCMYDIVGVTSFGKACGLAPNVPGVYTRVSHYVKWIEDVVWPPK